MQALAARTARRQRRPLLLGVLAVLAAGAGIGYVVHGAVGAGGGGTGGDHRSGGRAAASSAKVRRRAPAFTVLATTPASGSRNVASDAPITVRFSSPLAEHPTDPTLAPPIDGRWARRGSSALVFDPAAPFVPSTTETLTVPGGAQGVAAADGRLLPGPDTVSFTVAGGSVLRLQQLLAQLDYLPVSFTSSGPAVAPEDEAQPQPGNFTWRWSGLPLTLVALWTPGAASEITTAAVMAFENDNGLAVDGVAGPQVWTTLLADVAAGKTDPNPWVYVYVSKSIPETLTVYVNGNVQFSNVLVNTGVPGADTTDGTYAVFEHVVASDMKGTNPDGTTYNDPNVPWASYFNGGDALHGFVRAQYGFPQSNGCVEMPIATAGQIWPLTPIGTLVSVVGPPVT